MIDQTPTPPDLSAQRKTEMTDKDPHAEGLDARLAGEPETANPYDVEDDFDAFCAWNDGWASEDEE